MFPLSKESKILDVWNSLEKKTLHHTKHLHAKFDVILEGECQIWCYFRRGMPNLV